MGKFGSSYPPGCDGVPADEPGESPEAEKVRSILEEEAYDGLTQTNIDEVLEIVERLAFAAAGECPRCVQEGEQNMMRDLVIDHHREQFGSVTLERLGVKLGEEAGEVCGALIRHLELRDGRSWDSEVAREIGHVATVLRVICSRLGRRLEDVINEGDSEFLRRKWRNVERQP